MLAYGSGSGLDVGVASSCGWSGRANAWARSAQQVRFQPVALSPDEKRISFTRQTRGRCGCWLHDVAGGVRRGHHFALALRWIASGPGWKPIVFQSDYNLYKKPANNTGKEELLFHGALQPVLWMVTRWEVLVYGIQSGVAGSDLWLLPLDGDRKHVPYLNRLQRSFGQFSPDGRWMAYASNESGPAQIYGQAIPASGAKSQISTAGATSQVAARR